MRQDHAHALDRRRAEGRRRHGHRARGTRRDRAPASSRRLRHAGGVGVRRPDDPPEPRVLRAADRRAAQRRRPRHRRDRARREREADRRVAQRRAGEPGLARRRDARLARAHGPRRADGGPGPPPARRALDGVPRARRPRHHDHREQPRHGRGAALRPARAHAGGPDHRRHDSRPPARRHRRGRIRMPRSSRSSSATRRALGRASIPAHVASRARRRRE